MSMTPLTDISTLAAASAIVVEAAWTCVTGFGPDDEDVRNAFARAGISVSRIDEDLTSGPTFRSITVNGRTLQDRSIGEYRVKVREELDGAMSALCASVRVGQIGVPEREPLLKVPTTTAVSLASLALIGLVGMAVVFRFVR